MDVLALTRKLVDIESTTGNEAHVGACVLQLLQKLTSQYAGVAEQIEVAPERFNVLARFGEPCVTLSTHLDTVPPFIPLLEDETHIWGRGACDAKGIAAAMICAAGSLLAAGVQGRAAVRARGQRPHGPFGLPGAGRVGHREAAGRAGQSAPDSAPARC